MVAWAAYPTTYDEKDLYHPIKRNQTVNLPRQITGIGNPVRGNLWPEWPRYICAGRGLFPLHPVLQMDGLSYIAMI